MRNSVFFQQCFINYEERLGELLGSLEERLPHRDPKEGPFQLLLNSKCVSYLSFFLLNIQSGFKDSDARQRLFSQKRSLNSKAARSVVFDFDILTKQVIKFQIETNSIVYLSNKG